MPYPSNLTTALSVEACVRESGAIPATIGILDGRIHVGLSRAQLERMADTKNTLSSKVSRRDIAAICAFKGNGGTTIAGTTVIAKLAGIKVFATGGLGGVHRGGENTMDISADLTELARSSVAVIAGGVKSILDIGRTLEYLETQGVPVITYGPTKEFPAFFSPRSGFQSPYNVSSPLEAAKLIYHGDLLNMENGYFFGCPIPERYAAAGETIQCAVDQAVEESKANGMDKKGKEVTPWLLNRVYELTGGSSLENNVALIENTSRIGGRVAVEYAKLMNSGGTVTQPDVIFPMPSTKPSEVPAQLKPPKALVIGGAAVDIISRVTETVTFSSIQHSTIPGSVTSTLGGVARNVAEAAHRVRTSSAPSNKDDIMLISPLGHDSFGSLLKDETAAIGMRTDGFSYPSSSSTSGTSALRTAVCNMILDGKGDLVGGVADMDIISSLQFNNVTVQLPTKGPLPEVSVMDGNLANATMTEICQWAHDNGVATFFEPTSVAKSTKILDAIQYLLKIPSEALPGKMHPSPITYISPNILELQHIYSALEANMELNSAIREQWWNVVDDLGLGQDYQSQLTILARQPVSSDASTTSARLDFMTEKGVARMAVQLLPFFQHLIVKCGQAGVLLAMRVPNTPGNVWAQEKSDPRSRRQIVAKGKRAIYVLKHFPAMSLGNSKVVNVTGAGDSLVGSIVATLVENPDAMQDPVAVDLMIERAQKAAVLTLQSDLAVSPLLGKLAAP
ncbi:hypothetical protein M408DRAFT_29500 [Serendipita vermifera MAFF 305830]|uniref:Carbohydrate kinase PfkB domain-containing protein n=1 Tax=Serendipita vermifera MAFF 305830 TaxID=933852 RepID=A0A0C3AQL4_SERVB|nr:hypothetical protein M408DRAFT_29500 [Serendipita vermifera MAFF 305830]